MNTFRLLKVPWVPTNQQMLRKHKKKDGLKTGFQVKWLKSYAWLIYSPSERGAFCSYCVLFSPDGSGGRGHQPIGTYALASFTI